MTSPSSVKERKKLVSATKLDEPVLPDDYKMYASYAYVIDGKPKVWWEEHGCTVREAKWRHGIKEVRRCDLSGRDLL